MVTATGSPPLVMVIDDEPHLRHALKAALQSAGYAVLDAADGETAVALARSRRPDVALVDLVMPGMNGREVCGRIREVSAGTAVVYLTGKADAFEASGASELRAEAEGLVTKPATKLQVLQAIADAYRSRPG